MLHYQIQWANKIQTPLISKPHHAMVINDVEWCLHLVTWHISKKKLPNPWLHPLSPITCRKQTLQEILSFFTGNFGRKIPPYGFFPLGPTWQNCHSRQVDLDLTIFIGSFWLIFFIRFFLLNYHDNNIIWTTTIHIYYLNYVI